MNEWISVKERLPISGQRVVVFAKSKWGSPHVTICTFYVIRENRVIPRLRWSRGIYEVTHWMPLPEPPEEG